jgi:hypothetical protein
MISADAERPRTQDSALSSRYARKQVVWVLNLREIPAVGFGPKSGPKELCPVQSSFGRNPRNNGRVQRRKPFTGFDFHRPMVAALSGKGLSPDD